MRTEKTTENHKGTGGNQKYIIGHHNKTERYRKKTG